MNPAPDIFAAGGLAAYGKALRHGAASAAQVTADLVARIAEFDGRLQSFTHVAGEHALEGACGIDQLARARTDLGPLMGVPIAVKDLYAVDGMPLTAGSRIDVQPVAPREGSLVRKLKQGGAVILGKTRTTEFAFGTFNLTHPTAWNPADLATHRMPGGSSAGSAVAQAASLAPLTFGTDTGGSVRLPAALCGIAGFKATCGVLPMDGVFPLSTTLDSPGWFASSAIDLELVWRALTGQPPGPNAPVNRLRLGQPATHFFDDLDPEVGAAMERALARLAQAGCEIVSIELPSVSNIDAVFGAFIGAELTAHLGRDHVDRHLDDMDPLVRGRILPGLELKAAEYVRIGEHLRRIAREAHAASAHVDAIVTPTCPLLPAPIAASDSVERAAAWVRNALRCTRPINMFGMCGVSLPIAHLVGSLPVGIQLVAHAGSDSRLLAIALSVESELGLPARFRLRP